MLWKDGNKMVDKHLQDHSEERKFWTNEMENENLIVDNLNVFRNFLDA